MNGRRIWTVLGIGALGSQAGHLLAYQARFGASAWQVQSTGAHAYFPTALHLSLGVAALLGLGGLFVMGLARIAIGRRIRPGSAPDLLRLLAVLYTVQLAMFAGQEVGEALLAGMPVDTVTHLLLWGTLGQLPVAMVAAAGLRWLLVRFEVAVTEIRLALANAPALHIEVTVAVRVWSHAGAWLSLRAAAGMSLTRRGPPSNLRFSQA